VRFCSTGPFVPADEEPLRHGLQNLQLGHALAETPLLFVKKLLFNQSCAARRALFIWWKRQYLLHPSDFSQETNEPFCAPARTKCAAAKTCFTKKTASIGDDQQRYPIPQRNARRIQALRP
jgi:hypothetical protein